MAAKNERPARRRSIVERDTWICADKYVLPHSSSPLIIMSFALLRAPIRRAAVSTATPRAAFRSSYRRFSTNPPPPPPKSSNIGLFAGLGIAALAGGAYYYYYAISPAGADAGTAAKSALQSAKAAAKFTPSKEDYQKVPYNTHVTVHPAP